MPKYNSERGIQTLEKVSDVVLESAPCPNGCPLDDKSLFVARDRLFDLPGNYHVVRCNHCGLVRTEPRPTSASMSFYYLSDKYPAYQASNNLKADNNKLFGNLLSTMYHKVFGFHGYNVVPNIPPGKMLEVGCSTGQFLRKMSAKGWSVEGIELSETAAAQAEASGFNVSCGSLESTPDQCMRGRFDLIVGWMVIEHLHDPVLGLRKLKCWTRPGGWLAISIPNATNFSLSLFKDKWSALQVPTHLYHFDEKSIVSLLALTGWHTVNVIHSRSLTIFAHSISNILEDYCMSRWLSVIACSPIGLILLFPFSCLLSAFGQGGVITIWARRNPDV
jgi:2-polyprenyl-3-methyl-5-hydroxy-6-metoxy-1,4-benzoquinol methylase